MSNKKARFELEENDYISDGNIYYEYPDEDFEDPTQLDHSYYVGVDFQSN